jgi:RNA recognition motif-containing protein
VNIYVGNLSYSTTESELRQAFEAFGTVESVNVIQDRETGRSKGFGFVVMPDNAQGQAAIAGVNDKDMGGRRVKVNEARPRSDKPAGGGFGGGGGGGGGRGGGRGGDRGGDRHSW